MVTPVYLQIVDDIKNKINGGILKPGDAIDSEHSLCREYGVSRMTVRKGLSILAGDDYIYSIHGKGNYVKAHDLTKYTILFDEMKNPINSVDKTRLLGVNIIKPNQRMIDNLQISQYKKVIEIKRLFYTEGQPVAYDVKYLLYQRGMPIVEKEIQYATFPEMIAKSVSLFTLKKELTICAQIPDEEMKHALKIYNDTALLVIELRLLNSEHKPVGLAMTYYRGDYIKVFGYSD